MDWHFWLIQTAKKGRYMSEENSAPVESQESSEGYSEESGEVSQEGSEGSNEVIQEAVEDALAQGASKKEIQNLIKEYELKINGKTKKVSVDLGNDDFIRNQLQLAEVSRMKMQESADLKKLYEKEVGRLKQDPWAVLKELGLDPDELAELRIQSRIEEMKKSPEQLEKENIQRELQEARAEATRLKEERESEQFDKMKEQASIQIESEIESALDAHKTLPKSRHIVKRIADSMLWALNNGFEDVSAEDVLPLVEKEWKEEMSRLMDDSPEEMLEQLIGQRNIERMRTKRLGSMNTAPPKNLSSIKSTTNSIQKTETKPAEKMSQRAFFKTIGKKK
jgi:hypothetical protein